MEPSCVCVHDMHLVNLSYYYVNFPFNYLIYSHQGWLGSTKMKCPLGFHRVLPVLHQIGAPKEVCDDLHYYTQFEQYS